MSTSAAGTIPPPISWAQRNDLIFLNIDVECKDIEHKVTEDKFHFKGINALDATKKYDVTLNLSKAVDPERVSCKNIGRCLEFVIHKKESGPYWPSLTTDKKKLHFLTSNFSKWKNESDEEDDAMPAGNPFNFDMNAGNMDWSSKEKFDFNVDDDDDDDSDDDNIPSLAPNDEDDEKPEEKPNNEEKK